MVKVSVVLVLVSGISIGTQACGVGMRHDLLASSAAWLGCNVGSAAARCPFAFDVKPLSPRAHETPNLGSRS